MVKSGKGMLRIRWIRSGTGFSCKQKEAVRSLGLRRLHHVVERPDTAHVRGLIARVSHLVEVVDSAERSEWSSGPEYAILHAPAASQGAGETSGPAAAKE